MQAALKPQAEKLVETLGELTALKPPYCLRQRIGECYGALFHAVGTTLLGALMNNFCDIIKTKEDSSWVNLRL